MRLSIRKISLTSAMGLFLSFTAWAVCASLCAAGICAEKPQKPSGHPCCHSLDAKKEAPKCEKCVIQAKIQAQKTASDKSHATIDLSFPVLSIPPVAFSYEEPQGSRGLPAEEQCNSPPGGESRPDAPRAPPVS